MLNRQARVVLGTTRRLLCQWCSAANGMPMHREHVYGEVRGWRQFERFWECLACGHQIVATDPDAVPDPQADPEIERLHAQWREDNQQT